MTGAQRYQHERDHDRSPTGHYIGLDRDCSRAEMAEAWDAADQPDEAEVQMIAMPVLTLAIVLWVLALAGFAVGLGVGLSISAWWPI